MPLADDDLLRCFSTIDFSARRAVVAAVSGGSDSTALLLLLKDFLAASAPATKLVAVTVDHALRPQSTAEAASVSRLALTLGIAHRTMRWTGPKPATGMPAAARAARYRLLAKAARDEGADLVFTGHTADDQAETVIMRAARDSGRGMAGMAPATLHDGDIWIVRPLLSARRERLRDYLRQHTVEWADDPTNADTRYERPRLRAAMSSDDIDAALETARDVARKRRALGQQAAELIERFAECPAAGLIRLQSDFVQSDNRPAAIYALRILLAITGGTEFLPDEARTARLFACLGDQPFCATLSRSLVDVRRHGIFLHREMRDLPAAEPLQDGMLWDRRYRIAGASADDAWVGPGGGNVAEFPRHCPESLVRAAAMAAPSIHGADISSAKSWLSFTPVLAPWARFLPSFDLAPAGAAAKLFGAPVPPAPPCTEHNIGSA